jgi:hypothetical protein
MNDMPLASSGGDRKGSPVPTRCFVLGQFELPYLPLKVSGRIAEERNDHK